MHSFNCSCKILAEVKNNEHIDLYIDVDPFPENVSMTRSIKWFSQLLNKYIIITFKQ